MRGAACLLVAVILADVAADADCDAPSIRAAGGAVLHGVDPSGGSEACADFCVPDCFCCSHSVAALAAFVPAAPKRLIPVDAPPAEHSTAGTHPAVDHPPLPRA